MRQAADDRVLSLSSSLSATQDIDLPKTIMQLQMQQSAYQAALSATSEGDPAVARRLHEVTAVTFWLPRPDRCRAGRGRIGGDTCHT